MAILMVILEKNMRSLLSTDSLNKMELVLLGVLLQVALLHFNLNRRWTTINVQHVLNTTV